MASKLSNVKYYWGGVEAPSTVFGWESSRTRVVRFEFTTGTYGATSITIRTQEDTISFQDGTQMTKIPFYVTTSDNSHVNALASNGYAVSGYLTKNGNIWSGTANVLLKENTKYYVWFFPYDKTYGWYFWHNTSTYYTSYELSGTAKFSLSVSPGTGSTISVNRTQSALGSSMAPTGALRNGSAIYKGDRLQISFVPNTNYGIDIHTVNGVSFASGNTHTVSGNVAIVSTAFILASDVGATDANIGSVSTITITKRGTSYYHSLQYSFGDLTGYITSSGGVQDSEVKLSASSVPFRLPTSFYAQIPNSKTGECRITCRTYSSANSTAVLGTPSTCSFVVTATGSPTINNTLIDIDPVTTALTGDNRIIIRYKSNPRCTVNAIPKNSSSISSIRVMGNELSFNVTDDGVAVAEKTYVDTPYTSYDVVATDSRGYKVGGTLRPTVIDYIQLTCSPVIYRPTPTGGDITVSVTGSFYRGSFGAISNNLVLDYRYKTVGGSYGQWVEIPNININIGTAQYSVDKLSLGSDFDYKQGYVFQVRARDGSSEHVLSTVTKTIEVQKGVPIFDWGENDFNVNGELRVSNVNIMNIIYPIGSVYMHSSDMLPDQISMIGSWTGINTGIDGVYAWKRLS